MRGRYQALLTTRGFASASEIWHEGSGAKYLLLHGPVMGSYDCHPIHPGSLVVVISYVPSVRDGCHPNHGRPLRRDVYGPAISSHNVCRMNSNPSIKSGDSGHKTQLKYLKTKSRGRGTYSRLIGIWTCVEPEKTTCLAFPTAWR